MIGVRNARSPIIVGREAELSAIRQGLTAASRGRGGCVFVLGEAGSGKSALLREARAAAEREGLVCLAASPAKAVRPPAFGVLAALLRSWTRRHGMPVEALAPFAPGLQRVLPEWPAPAQPPDLSSDQLHLLTLEGALRLLAHAAGHAGAVALVDDIHDADLETLELLHHAAGSVREERLLILGAVRTPEGQVAEAEVRGLERTDLAAVLELQPLADREVAEIVEAILGVPPPPGLVEHLAARSDGIPLLVEELVDAQLSSGALRIQWGRAHWSGDAAAVRGATIPTVVRDKLARLSAPARAVVVTSGLLNRFDPMLVGAVADVDPSVVTAAFREGVNVGLIEPTPEEMAFRHALVRDALVDTLLPQERVEIHRRAAAAMDHLHGSDPEWLQERARHLEAAGEDEAAAALLVEAGTGSLRAHAPASAHALLSRAAQLARTPVTRDKALDALAGALGSLGRWGEALRLDAELLARQGENAGRLTRMAHNAVLAGRLQDVDSLTERARGAGAGDLDLVGPTALALLWRGRLQEAVRAANEALTLASAAGDRRRACEALDVLGRATDALGHREAARAYFVRWIELSRAEGLVGQHLQALLELGTQEFLSGGPADRLFEARALAERHHAYVPQVLANLSLLWWLGRRARLSEATQAGETAVTLCRRFSLDLLPHALIDLGWAQNLARCGDGEPLVAEALALAPHDEDLQILAAWMRGESALREARTDEAIRHLEDANQRMEAAPAGVPPPAPFLWVAALVVAGRTEHAAEAMARVASSPALPRQYVNRLWLAVDEALLAGDAAAFDEAIKPYRESASFDVAVAQVVAATALGGSEAIRWLHHALSVFETGGLATDAGWARSLLRRHGGPVPRARRPAASHPLGVRGVTPREAEVLTHLAQGRTNREIAELLFLSPRTVQTHVASLLRKLDVSNRASLIALALRLEPHGDPSVKARP
jgi:DNA-binding CsgD family transcriptional regulator/type II secretory pathway predicted ATPase ExeA/tetratricopeptide (TPR) repeat protein